jgi:hypothetical protein
MPLVGSILVVGGSQQRGADWTIKCDRCKRFVRESWTVRCAFSGCSRDHFYCATCLNEIQRFACADPNAAYARLNAAAERAPAKEDHS